MMNFNADLTPADALAHVFENNRNRPWVFVRPLGNWGDHLIFAGAEYLATSIGLKWVSCETAEFESFQTTSDHCVYLQGGGGYNSWGSGRAFVNLELAVARPVHMVVQGPMSTEGDLQWLATRMRNALSTVRCRNTLIFAREQTTLKILHSLALTEFGVTVCSGQDTALELNTTRLLEIARLPTLPEAKYELVVLREDNEQPTALFTGDTPIIRALRSDAIAIDPAYVASSFSHWVKIHLLARSITTNRLHSSIVGLIAGKPVTMGPGSYHKNQSVWSSSLRHRGVKWVDKIEHPSDPLWRVLPQWMRDSYKIRQLRLLYHGVPLS